MPPAPIETTQQGEGSGLKSELEKHIDKMMQLKLSQLKKRAKTTGIPDEAIKEAAAGAGDEDDTKRVLISLILKAACLKANPLPPSPARGRKPETWACAICPGCIRPPNHDGPCMDGQCNEIFPESPKKELGPDVAAEISRHKVVKEEVLRKVQKTEKEEEARKQAAGEAHRKAAEEARRKAVEEARRKAAKEEEEARKKAAEEEARQKEAEEEARRKAVEEEAARQAAEEEAARLKEIEDARARRRAEEAAELAAMDERCVDAFLECVNPCGRRDRVRTPLKGTILYTKFMRPCRPMGTSVDVKDSNFVSLGNFLQFLEGEGLLRLKPGLTDPVVTDICVNACRDYKYVPMHQSSPIQEAPKDAGYPASGVSSGLARWQ